MKIDPYSILEINPRATTEVAAAAYRALAKLYQADESKLKALNAAKEILLDKTKRKEYDQQKSSPKKFGNYKVVSEIAEGGFGKTYRGVHEILGTPVCLKQAHTISPQDEVVLLEEAKAMWDLRHYSIPSIREVLRMEDGSIVLVMSYIPGVTLEKIIDKHKRLDAEHVAWIIDRSLNALKYLHMHGIIHGDIKPQNIIVQSESHQVVLVDYGLSLIKPTKKVTNKGYTPFFSSPEAIRGDPLLPESDFYSLGMTAIYALGGDVESKQVPSTTPDIFCRFIKSLVVHDLRNRPEWNKIDLVEEIKNVRFQSFGRHSSGMKPLPIV